MTLLAQGLNDTFSQIARLSINSIYISRILKFHDIKYRLLSQQKLKRILFKRMENKRFSSGENTDLPFTFITLINKYYNCYISHTLNFLTFNLLANMCTK